MSDPRQALIGRSLSVVTQALSRVRDAALERALDPKNVAKGDWRELSTTALLCIFDEEVREFWWAVEDREPLPRILSEAGDVVWTVAMICDVAVRGRR